jgi:DUF4097 and DUF4098 domain-containing protein YvlB
MIATLLAATTLAALPLQQSPESREAARQAARQQPDTTFEVSKGQRLEVEVFAGAVTVKTWDRSAVRVRAVDMGARAELEVDRDGPTVSVDVSGRHGTPTSADLEVTAPSWMAVSLEGVHTDMSVAGINAPIALETVSGNIDVQGGRETVDIQTVEGTIVLRGAQGRLDLSSVNNAVTVTGAKGELNVETVNGAIRLTDVDVSSLDLSTVNGDVGFTGPLRDDGHYVLTSHNGAIDLAIAGEPDATFSISTFGGELSTEFAVSVSGERGSRRGKRINFSLGGGSAQVELESFNGRITLRRAGGAPAK